MPCRQEEETHGSPLRRLWQGSSPGEPDLPLEHQDEAKLVAKRAAGARLGQRHTAASHGMYALLTLWQGATSRLGQPFVPLAPSAHGRSLLVVRRLRYGTYSLGRRLRPPRSNRLTQTRSRRPMALGTRITCTCMERPPHPRSSRHPQSMRRRQRGCEGLTARALSAGGGSWPEDRRHRRRLSRPPRAPHLPPRHTWRYGRSSLRPRRCNP